MKSKTKHNRGVEAKQSNKRISKALAEMYQIKSDPKQTASYVTGMLEAEQRRKRPHHGYCFWSPKYGLMAESFFLKNEDSWFYATGKIHFPEISFEAEKKHLKKQGCKVVKVRLEVVE